MSDNAYLLRTYGITLEEREAIAAAQGYRCICGRDLNDPTTRWEVDHEHFKVFAIREVSPKNERGWNAQARLAGAPIMWAKTKEAAVKLAKKAGLRLSVRGILCGGRYAGCNRKLGKVDDPKWLKSAHDYIADPPARKVLTHS